MSWSKGTSARSHLAVAVLTACFGLAGAAPTHALPFDSMPLQPVSVSATTGEKPQSKVWSHGGQWWCVLPDGSGSWLRRLDGDTWTDVLQLSTNTGTKADVKAVGDDAHVLLFAGATSQLVSLHYGANTYSISSGPTSITLDSGVEIATIDIDSTGRMWLASDGTTTINVRYSDPPYTAWSGPETIATGVSTDDISVVVALPAELSVGVLWSNQATRRFGFRVHPDGSPPSIWGDDEVPASQSAQNVGLGMADDHLNVAVASDATLYAAVKTSYDTAGYPRVALLVRRSNGPAPGSWDDLYSVDEAGTRGIVLLDEITDVVTVVYTSTEGLNDIVFKESPTSAISFGARSTLIAGSNNDVTSTKQNIVGEVVLLASTATTATGVLRSNAALAGHWPMDETGGLQILDVSGNGNDGIVVGAPARVPGIQGLALDFNGSSQYATIAPDPTLDITGEITVACWVYPRVVNTQNLIKKAINGNTNGYELSLASSTSGSGPSKFFFRFNQQSSGDTYRVNSTTNYPLNTWTHIAGTYDGSVMRLYVNGVLNNSVTGPAAIASNTLAVCFAAQPDAGASFKLNGRMDDARIFSRALSATEIAALADAAPPTVALLAPNGGEIWPVGSSQTISWTATDIIGVTAIDIEYSTDSGASWDVVATGLANSGTFAWTVPTTPTPAARVRVAAYDAAGSTTSDASDTDFEIQAGGAPVVALDAPNGGELWPVGATRNITWTASDDQGVTAIDLELSTDSGSSWSDIAVGLANTGTYAWLVPTTPTRAALVRVTAHDADLNSTSDTSDAVFAIADLASPLAYWPFEEGGGPEILDASALGNDGTLYGSPSWATGVRGQSLVLNGSTQYALVPDNPSLDLTTGITLACWVKPGRVGTQYVIKKAIIDGGPGSDGYELSLATTGVAFVRFNQVAYANTYRINATTPYPTDGTWMHLAATFDGTAIRLYVNGTQEGATLNMPVPITINTLPLGIGAQSNGTTPFQGAMDEARVYGRALSPTEVRILADITPPTITLSSPNGGEVWLAGSTQAITWTAADDVELDTIALDFSTDGASWSSIASGLANSGSYDWVVPAVPSTTVRVRATARDAATNSASDQSDADFEIRTELLPDLAITPSPLDFGPVVIGSTASQELTLTHMGEIDDPPIELTALTLGGSPAYSIPASPTLPLLIPPQGSVVLTLQFAPLDPIAHAGNLEATHDGNNTPLNVALLGQGVTGVVAARADDCITATDPCLSVAVEYERVDAIPARGASIHIQLSPELELCTPDDPGLSILQGSWLASYASTFQVGDLGGGLYIVDQAILGSPCGATGGGTLFTIDVRGTVADGSGTIAVGSVVVRDCVNQPIVTTAGPDAEVVIDSTVPAPVDDLLATQVRDANEGDGTTQILVEFTVPGGTDSVEVWRAPFGDYPEYDDGLGSVPAVPSYPPPSPWEHTTVPTGGGTDEPPTRDFWYYVAFARDACGNISPVSETTGGTLNYHLGDVTDGTSPGSGDNLVTAVDVTLLGNHYGEVSTDPEWLNYLDVGPTTDYSVHSRPTTDNAVGFEDLMLFAVNFGQVGLAASPSEIADAPPPPPQLVLRTEVTPGGLIAHLFLEENSGQVKGIHAVVDFDLASLVLERVHEGSLLAGQGNPIFFTHRNEEGVGIHAAILGADVTLQGSGEIATLFFRGQGAMHIRQADLRDARNGFLGAPPTSTGVEAPTAPTPTRFELLGAQPNPFNPTTTFRFLLPEAASAELLIYDVAGKLVRTVLQAELAPGEYLATWDGRNDRGRAVTSGVYLLHLRAGNREATRKLQLVK